MAATGHRTLPHTADLLVEAWGPSRADCFAEAVRGLLESFADVARAAPSRSVPLRVAPGDDARMLADLLDEVVYLVDAEGVVPVVAAVADASDGGLVATFGVVGSGEVEQIGPAPKGVTLHGLSVQDGPDGWHCTVVVDV